MPWEQSQELAAEKMYAPQQPLPTELTEYAVVERCVHELEVSWTTWIGSPEQSLLA